MNELNSQFQLKNFNRRSVLNYIRKNIHTTKRELASVTGLTFMAIKKNLEELESLNLIRGAEFEVGGIGRRAITYTINERYGYTIGVHVNIFMTSVALMDLRGSVLAKESCDMSQPITTQTAFVEMIVGLISRAIEKSGVEKKMILGIGLGVPGPVDFKEGVVLVPPNFPVLHYLPLKQILEEKLGYKVFLHKDTNAIAIGEYWRGAGIEYTNVVYIDIDMGIGSGLVINGELNQGANNIAGEFGHITLDINGPLCNCGNQGCLEAMGSGLSVLREFSKQLEDVPEHSLYPKRNQLVIQDVLEATNKNDLYAIPIMNKSAFYTGVAISNLINILDPQIIILGGVLIQNYPRYFDIAKDVAYSRRIKGARENIIVTSKLKEEAGIIGAGEIVVNNFFDEIIHKVLSKNQ